MQNADPRGRKPPPPQTPPGAAPEPEAKQSAKMSGLVSRIAGRYGVDADKLLTTLKSTVFKGPKQQDGTFREATNEELMALLAVSDEYHLNPFTKEIYAFPDEKRGGIVPVVSVDGWLRIINERPELTAIEFEYAPDDSTDQWIGCTICRNDRTKPIQVREYLVECRRNTGPWDSHPRRMLRHKVLIQCARIAFGFSGIYDPDEAERIRDANAIDAVATEVKPRTRAPQAISAPKANPLNELHATPPGEAVPVGAEPAEETEAGARG